MYLIDETYFVGDLVIPQGGGIDVPSTDNNIKLWIDRYSRELLRDALGNALFDELDSQISNGELDAGADVKWGNLVNGCTYTYNDRQYNWRGLIFKDGDFKMSILAYYVYHHWHQAQVTRMSGVGEVRGNAVNSTNADSTYRTVRVWNTFVDLYQRRPIRHQSDVSLLYFIYHNGEDYPNALLKTKQGYINTMGL